MGNCQTKMSSILNYLILSTIGLSFFLILNIDSSFLHSNVSEWHTMPSYIKGEMAVRSVMSTNDIAERAVKVASDYNAVLTKDPEQYKIICANAYQTRKQK